MSAPLVALVTDFGRDDSYVAEMHLAVVRAVPSARVIDVTHDLAPILHSYLGASTGRLTQTLSVLWGVQQILLAALNAMLVTTLPIEAYLAVRPFLGIVLAAPLLGISGVLLRRHHRSAAKMLLSH